MANPTATGERSLDRSDFDRDPSARGRGDGRPWYRRPIALLVAIFVLSTPLITPYLRGDGVGYYAWLRSPVVDGDFHFENEFRRADPAVYAHVFDAEGELAPGQLTETGHVRNQFGVGASVVLAPFFLGAHAVVLTGRAVGLGWAADGFSLPYRWLTAFGGALLAFLGLVVAYRFARRFFGEGPALLATVAVWGASALPVYQYFLPFRPYVPAILFAALLLVVWHRGGWDGRRWLALGLLGGLLVILHPVAVAWLLLPALSLLGWERGGIRERLRAGSLLALGGAIAAVPQMIGKAIVFGSPINPGYQAEWDFARPDVLRVLFGARHGLISWTPVIGLALIGLWRLTRRVDRRLGLGLWAVFAAMVGILSVYATPEGSSFSNRFFILFTPGFVLGGAALAAWVWERRRPLARRLAVGATAVLIAWNALFAFQWAWGLLPKSEAIDWSTMARNQFTTAPRELVRAAKLFVTDRDALISYVQQVDLEKREAGAY